MVTNKKFYRDFSDEEVEGFNQLKSKMQECYVQIPPFIIKRMVDRGIIPNDLGIIDSDGESLVKDKMYKLNYVPEYRAVEKAIHSGIPYEFSDEGQQNPYTPYRVVMAHEVGPQTFFVKVAVPPMNHVVRVIDVWTKKGQIPFYPLSSQRDVFLDGADWNIEDIIHDVLDMADENKPVKAGDFNQEEELPTGALRAFKN